jgi:hypothetical protein
MSMDDFETDECGMSAYVTAQVMDEFNDEFGHCSPEYDELENACQFAQSNRRFRRDRMIALAADRLQDALEPLYSFDDGHSDYGYEGVNYSEWDTLYPPALETFEDLERATKAAERLWELQLTVEALADDESEAEQRQAILRREPDTSPPTRLLRSQPDLAIAPPLPRVAPLSDDAVVTLAA